MKVSDIDTDGVAFGKAMIDAESMGEEELLQHLITLDGKGQTAKLAYLTVLRSRDKDAFIKNWRAIILDG